MGHLYIYKITNLNNGKVYIGRTRRNPPERRWGQHIYTARCREERYAIHRAIRKYGAENFRFDVIAEFDDESAWMRAETDFIVRYRSFERTRGYNICMGGEGAGPRLDEARVMRARRMYVTGKYTLKQLSEKLHVNLTLLKRAVRGYDSYARIGTPLPRDQFGWVKRPARPKKDMKALSPEEVAELRRQFRDGASCEELARRRRVGRSLIGNAVFGRGWYNTVRCEEPPAQHISKALHPDEIEKVRALYATGRRSYEQLARDFGTSRRAIRSAILGLGRYGRVGTPLARALTKAERAELLRAEASGE